MNETALAALYTAASAIRTMAGVKECTAENDNKSGEIIFTLNNGKVFILRLTDVTHL